MKRLFLLLSTILIIQSCKTFTHLGEGGITVTYSDDEQLQDERASQAKKEHLKEVIPILEEMGIEPTSEEALEALRISVDEKSAKLGANILRNGSFEEGFPGLSSKPDYWLDCGWVSESPPDLHSSGGVAFEVYQEAIDGYQYVGLVVRSNETYECLYQELDVPMNPGVYDLMLVVSRSPLYVSVAQVTGDDANLNNPVILEVRGTRSIDGKEFMLFQTDPIESTDWVIIEDIIKIEDDVSKIKFLSFFVGEETYNGNVLIDKIVIAKR